MLLQSSPPCPTSAPLRVATWGATASLLFGCAVATPDEALSNVSGEPYALVDIELEHRGAESAASVLSAFVDLAPGPHTQDALAPHDLTVPSGSGCSYRRTATPTATDSALKEDALSPIPGGSSFSSVGFLGAGLRIADSVELRLGRAPSEPLAPYAFPRLGRQLGGAVYSSRRLALTGSQVGASLEVTLIARGLSGPMELPVEGQDAGPETSEFSFQVPTGVVDFAVQGVPVSDLPAISLSAPLDLSWSPSQSRSEPPDAPDWVMVELETEARTLGCAYPSLDGAGSIPPSWLLGFALDHSSEVAVRVRSIGRRQAQRPRGLSGAEIRFDVTLARSTLDVTMEQGPSGSKVTTPEGAF